MITEIPEYRPSSRDLLVLFELTDEAYDKRIRIFKAEMMIEAEEQRRWLGNAINIRCNSSSSLDEYVRSIESGYGRIPLDSGSHFTINRRRISLKNKTVLEVTKRNSI